MSLITKIVLSFGISTSVFNSLKELSKFLIVLAMMAIDLNTTNIVELIKPSGKPLLMGLACWIVITCVSLRMQSVLNFL